MDMELHAALASYQAPFMLHLKLPLLGRLFSGVAREKSGAEKHAQAQLNPWMQKK
jgi:hypothetical protein